MIDLSRAKVNKRIPKNRFNKAVLTDVDTIMWLYKISADTASFRHGDEIDEIQIFNVSFKGGKVNKKELTTIQKAIPYKVLFYVHDKWYYIIEGELFESGKRFLDGDNLMIERRSAKLTDLYEDIAAEFIPIQKRKDESVTVHVARYKSIVALEKEMASLKRRVDNEKQPNIRFELNDQLKELQSEKNKLI